jgi:hypothetical protein
MKRYPIFLALWVVINALLLVALAMFGYGVWWERSTRRYLAGFADAVVPLTAPPEVKVEAILSWMKSGPERGHLAESGVSLRDPENSLNYQELLRVCGTATNAFVNLATSSGLEARRLLLLDEGRVAKHVTAEVRLEGRWVVVDPLFHVLLREPGGRLVSKEQLRDAAVFREVTARIPGYPPEYSFERTSHVRLSKIPFIGPPLRRALDQVTPGWDSASIWSLLLERESLAFTLASGLLVMLALGMRWVLSLYCERRLGVVRIRLRDRLSGAWTALFRGPA